MMAESGTVPESAAAGVGVSIMPDAPKNLPPSFKKHKLLPHPKSQRLSSTPRTSRPHTIASDIRPASRPSTQPATSRSPRDDEILGSLPGPDLPPTPPAHSRSSSGNQSVLPSSPAYVATPVASVSDVSDASAPGTPSNQRSPPTPDVTPPQLARRQKTVSRPVPAERIPSKTTTDSRSASFTTARENPSSSEDDENFTLRQAPSSISSARPTSQSTIRPTSAHRQSQPQGVGLGLAMGPDENMTPRTRHEFLAFDGEWTSGNDVERQWDDNLNRDVVVRKYSSPRQTHQRREEVIENNPVAPTNATKALRQASMQSRVASSPLPRVPSGRRERRYAAHTNSVSSTSTEMKRWSGISTISAGSSAFEAGLVDGTPQRQRTLRHVRKQTALRESGSDISPSSSATTSLDQTDNTRRPRPGRRYPPNRSESLASSGTVNSIASRKARKDVWKAGGIPVVVIPDRSASIKSNRTPSLRSTSSRQSKQSNNVEPTSLPSNTQVKDFTPYFEKHFERARKGRGRTLSGSVVSVQTVQTDQLTMDYPPIVPMRKSSLSAPTSRNNSRAGSRTGSLTAESLKTHNALQDSLLARSPPKIMVQPESEPCADHISDNPAQQPVASASPVELHKDGVHGHRPTVDHAGFPFLSKRPSAHHTPFSQGSVETAGTHSVADISEAMAVNIYPHQNKSVLMVNHLSRLPDPEDDTPHESLPLEYSETSANNPDAGPLTPPQPQFSLEDVDSPLRNPRDPPAPPVINFIPATPSGLTPTTEQEKQLYAPDEMKRRPSLMRRALSLRKNSGTAAPRTSGFLTRTLSITKAYRPGSTENAAMEDDRRVVSKKYLTADGLPPDESMLHPHWRPADASETESDDEYDEDDVLEDAGPNDTMPRGKRPTPTRRDSLSDRIKRTFAILPVQDDDHYTKNGHQEPERRTIKRTPSGSLRVMRHRDSVGSLHGRPSMSRSREEKGDGQGRPSTAPDNVERPTWGNDKHFDERGRRVFPGWQDKVGQFGPRNLQRRLSEHRRQKRTDILRSKISGPREVRDGVGEVIKRDSYKGPSYVTPAAKRSPGSSETANPLHERSRDERQSEMMQI